VNGTKDMNYTVLNRKEHHDKVIKIMSHFILVSNRQKNKNFKSGLKKKKQNSYEKRERICLLSCSFHNKRTGAKYIDP